MTFLKSLLLTSAAAFYAGPAFAELTADQVLADQLRQMEYAGLTATVADQTRTGNAISVSQLQLGATVEGVEIDVTMGGAIFSEQPDGSVAITYEDAMPLAMTISIPDEEPVKINAILRSAGLSNIASGSPELIRYDFAADSAQITDVEIQMPDEDLDLDLNLVFDMAGLEGMIELSDRTVREYSANYTLSTLAIAFGFAAPEEEGNVNFNLSVADLAADYSGAIPRQTLEDSFATIIQNGQRTDGKMSHGAGMFALAADAPEGKFQVNGSVGSGEAVIRMGMEGLDYSASSNDTSLSFASAMMPLPPLNLSVAELDSRIAMPIVPGDAPQEMAIRIALNDMQFDDMIWGMFDPAGQLPRDAINFVLDLDSEVVMTDDIFDAEVMENMTAPPGQINSANLNELRFSIAGAELTGDGDFSFNNEFGFPMPSGVANFMLTGGNGLLDTLVGMGLVPEEQAMGARMMIGLFARPGDGEDTLVSTIELNEDGSILANGQRIK